MEYSTTPAGTQIDQAFSSVDPSVLFLKISKLHNTFEGKRATAFNCLCQRRSESCNKKPQVIHEYNEHKGGVDTFIKMIRGFSGKRNTNRWPMALWHIWRSHYMRNTSKSEKHKLFLKELSMELAQKQIHNRCKTKINSTTKVLMDLINLKRVPAVARSRPAVQIGFHN